MSRIRFADRLALARAERAARDALRPRRQIQGREGVRVLVDGRQLTSFCGNDYLGLGQHLDVVSAMQEAAAWHGVGSTGSPLVTGHHAEHALFEQEMAEWLGYERALFFGSGYQANLAVMQSLLGEGDLCVQDKLNHACLIDGARLSRATIHRYPHADLAALEAQLAASPARRKLVISDAVFSMDGDVADITRERVLDAARRLEPVLNPK